jgi:hypothetical protein
MAATESGLFSGAAAYAETFSSSGSSAILALMRLEEVDDSTCDYSRSQKLINFRAVRIKPEIDRRCSIASAAYRPCL